MTIKNKLLMLILKSCISMKLILLPKHNNINLNMCFHQSQNCPVSQLESGLLTLMKLDKSQNTKPFLNNNYPKNYQHRNSPLALMKAHFMELITNLKRIFQLQKSKSSRHNQRKITRIVTQAIQNSKFLERAFRPIYPARLSMKRILNQKALHAIQKVTESSLKLSQIAMKILILTIIRRMSTRLPSE